MGKQVLIVGAGLAGMVAARAAQRAGAGVLLIDRGAPGIGTNTALANGMFAITTASYAAGDYVRDVLETGKKINRMSYVRRVAEGASGIVPFLRDLGLEVAESAGACFVRASSPEVIPGVTLVRKLAAEIRSLSGVEILSGFHVTALLRDGGRIDGVKGFDKRGKDRTLYAAAVILACGGAGAIYGRNDNTRTILGQGYYLAARAGLELRDMEFIQSYPIVIAEPGLPSMMIYPPYPDEGRLLNADGEDVVEKHGLGNINAAIMKKRDTFSALLMEESRKGPVVMDLRGVPESAWQKHPLSLLERLHFDARRKPVRVAPAVHFCMGGVPIDGEGKTALDGLYACGEIVWGLHGANRMGGNALTECVVSGIMAGCGAAKGALSPNPVGSGKEEFSAAAIPARRDKKADFRKMRRIITDLAWRCAGIMRSGESMEEGLRQIRGIGRALRDAPVHSLSERIAKEDLISAAFVVKAILTASLGRRESRGTFIRSDYPLEDDSNWLKNSVITCDETEDRWRLRFEPAVRG
ncbi:MAG: FAD-binding protein [Deltaproteobacteria bacterium]|nr:FAD-binding protein [Deltaproteobacteria bacterium]